jgi:hypothetical protein
MAEPASIKMGDQPDRRVKDISLLETVLRAAAGLAAVSGLVALVIWVTWVMLDLKNLQSGFTLP